MGNDLTTLSGIGTAAARALAAAGITTPEALAAVDPENPPALSGFRGRPDWPAWIAAASASAGGEDENKPKPAEDKAETRPFEVISPLRRNGKLTGIGGSVRLSKPEFEKLRAAGVVAGAW